MYYTYSNNDGERTKDPHKETDAGRDFKQWLEKNGGDGLTRKTESVGKNALI